MYRDRGLLHPPLRVGRIALFNDTHLTRLRLITSMLDRGYNIAHVHEMLSAWEQGKDLGDMLGLESAIAGSWATEKPERMSVADAKRLVDDDAGVRAAGRPRRRSGSRTARQSIVRPKLIEAFNEIRQYGVTTDKLIDLHEQIAPLIDQISGILVQAGVEHVRRPDQSGRGAAAGYRSGRTDHDAGAVPHPGRRGGVGDAGVLDRVDDRVRRRSDPRRLHREGADRTRRRSRVTHSHSMVPGGLLVTSSTTRLTSGTSLVMRVEMRSSTS